MAPGVVHRRPRSSWLTGSRNVGPRAFYTALMSLQTVRAAILGHTHYGVLGTTSPTARAEPVSVLAWSHTPVRLRTSTRRCGRSTSKSNQPLASLREVTRVRVRLRRLSSGFRIWYRDVCGDFITTWIPSLAILYHHDLQKHGRHLTSPTFSLLASPSSTLI